MQRKNVTRARARVDSLARSVISCEMAFDIEQQNCERERAIRRKVTAHYRDMLASRVKLSPLRFVGNKMSHVYICRALHGREMIFRLSIDAHRRSRYSDRPFGKLHFRRRNDR